MADPTQRSEAISGMLNPTCGSCRHFVRGAPGQALGTCRFNPPTVMMIGARQDPVHGQLPLVNSYWPQVNDTIVCGQHTPRLMVGVDLSTLMAEEVKGEG